MSESAFVVAVRDAHARGNIWRQSVMYESLLNAILYTLYFYRSCALAKRMREL